MPCSYIFIQVATKSHLFYKYKLLEIYRLINNNTCTRLFVSLGTCESILQHATIILHLHVHVEMCTTDLQN